MTLRKLRENLLKDVQRDCAAEFIKCKLFFKEKKNIDSWIPHYQYPNITVRFPEKKKVNYYSLPKIKIDLENDVVVATQNYLVTKELKKYIDKKKKRLGHLAIATYRGKMYLFDGHHKYVYLKFFKKRKFAIARHINLDSQ